jgi:hypothetical protein
MDNSLLSFLGQALAIAASAFGGAWCAFLFENRKAAKDEQADRYSALRYAHLALLNQSSRLVALKEQLPSSRPPDATAWLTMLPTWSSFDVPRLDIRSLVYTITQPHDPDLLNRLLITEQRFLTFVMILEQRDKLHVALQDRLAALRAAGHLADPATLDQIEAAVGQPLSAQLKSSTSSLLSMLDSIIDGQERRLTELSTFAQNCFPGLPTPRHAVIPPDQRQ